MSNRQKKIPPPPRDKKSFTDESSEAPDSNNNTNIKVQEPDWDDFPSLDFETKYKEILIQEIDKKQNRKEFQFSTLLNSLHNDNK